jgi:hypothetical protein
MEQIFDKLTDQVIDIKTDLKDNKYKKIMETLGELRKKTVEKDGIKCNVLILFPSSNISKYNNQSFKNSMSIKHIYLTDYYMNQHCYDHCISMSQKLGENVFWMAVDVNKILTSKEKAGFGIRYDFTIYNSDTLYTGDDDGDHDLNVDTEMVNHVNVYHEFELVKVIITRL